MYIVFHRTSQGMNVNTHQDASQLFIHVFLLQVHTIAKVSQGEDYTELSLTKDCNFYSDHIYENRSPRMLLYD